MKVRKNGTDRKMRGEPSRAEETRAGPLAVEGTLGPVTTRTS